VRKRFSFFFLKNKLHQQIYLQNKKQKFISEHRLNGVTTSNSYPINFAR
jgi:hypothetical protein